jgi:aryl sulfotransferase
MTDVITWPRKTRELRNRILDSTIWNEFPIRDDDIIIATYAKSGTTWMQQIVAQLLFGGDPELEVWQLSPWVDMRFPPREVKLPLLEAQTHRRVIKTHLPVDSLVFSPKARYLYIGRDGRDIVWSFYHHHLNFNQEVYDRANKTPGGVGPPFERPPAAIRQYWRDWLDRDGYPWWPFWSSVRSWWEIRDLPNVLFVHFTNLKRDLPAEIRRIAAFLAIPIDETRWESILEYCSFEWMKANAAKVAPNGGASWEGGAQTFFHRGTNGRWLDTLTAAEIAEYEARAVHELGSEGAHWLATGELR